MRQTTISISVLAVSAVLLAGCAAGRAFRSGEDRARVGDWDSAVSYYRTAVQADPRKAEFRIALERAMLNASRAHFDAARQMEGKDQLDAALLEYRRTTEFDPSNRQALEKVVQLEKLIRDRIEASRPKTTMAELRDQARRTSAEPLLNPSSREPIRVQFNQANVRDILTFIGNASGINITYDPTVLDRATTINLTGSLEQALNAVLSANGLFYSILDPQTIVVAPDNAANHLKYDRQVAITLPISYGDSTELAQMLIAMTRTTTAAVAPVIVPNKTNNTITIRATQPVIDVIRELVLTNDKPRAEVTVDVEILEVNRTRVKQYGLNLSQFQVGGIFSPEGAPAGATGAATGATTGAPFNLNTISKGVSTADFYFAVPQAIVNFLETDSETKLLAKPQLRGSEGTKITFKVGTDEPYTQTAYSPIAAGGANVNPLTSYTFRTVGITLDVTPRVTDEGDIIMDVALENSARGEDRPLGGNATAPSFITRTLTSRLRLRDGESNLLAGLLRDEDRKSLTGFPGLLKVPVLKELFAANDKTISQTDIVMLLTPRIIRTHEYTARDLSPIYVGTNQNFGLTGPPPLIAAPPDAEPAPAAVPPAVAPGAPQAGTASPTFPQAGPPGQVTTLIPQAPPPQPAPPVPPPAAAPGSLPPGSFPPAGPQAAVPAVPPAQMPTNPPATGTSPPTASPSTAPMAQVSVTPPAGDVRVAGGPYMVPIYINGVSGLSTISVTVQFNPAALRVRTIQEGGFLRQGGVNVVFAPNTDAAIGRIDLTFVRTGDATGASGSGLLAAILFDAVGAGTSPLAVSGVAAGPGGTSIPIQFAPATVVVR